MKTRRKHSLNNILVAALGLAVLCLTGCASKPPIDHSEAELRAFLLSHVPIGSPVEKVDAYLKSINEKAVVVQSPPPPDLLEKARGAGNPLPLDTRVTIYAMMGEYYILPLQFNVVGVWMIDSKGKLCELWVLKRQSRL